MAEAGAGRRRVLVVSDDPQVRHGSEFGFPTDVEVVHALDAREAWGRLHDARADAVVVDMQSGSAGGFALARDMSTEARLRDIPILILLEREQDAWLARQAGATRYRTKPLKTSTLVDETLALLR